MGRFNTLQPIPLGNLLGEDSKSWIRFFVMKTNENIPLFATRFFHRADYVYNALNLKDTERKEISIRTHKEGLLLIAQNQQISDKITSNGGRIKHGIYEINCVEHEQLNLCKGVMFHHEFKGLTDEEILQDLKPYCPTLAKVRQYKKNGQNLGLVEVAFYNHIRPTSINIGFQAIEVKKYVENVRQCFKCWRFNHGSKTCSGVDTCVRCGSTEHSGQECTNQTKCINCEANDHTANDKTCPCFEDEKQIRVIMAEEYISYGMAKKEYQQKRKQNQTYAQATLHESKEVKVLKEENKALRNKIDYMEDEMRELREELKSLRASMVPPNEQKETKTDTDPKPKTTAKNKKSTVSTSQDTAAKKSQTLNSQTHESTAHNESKAYPFDYEDISDSEMETPKDYTIQGIKRTSGTQGGTRSKALVPNSQSRI